MRVNIILVMLIILCVISCKTSQEIVQPLDNYHKSYGYKENPNTYYKDTKNELQKFVGTWIYDNGKYYFRITIFKEKVIKNKKNKVYVDMLFTKFIYKNRGRIIYDNYGTNSYDQYPGLVNTKPSRLNSNFVKNDTLTFYYDEPSDYRRRRDQTLHITYSSDTVPKLYWKRTTKPQRIYGGRVNCMNGLTIDNFDLTIPTDMVLWYYSD